MVDPNTRDKIINLVLSGSNKFVKEIEFWMSIILNI